MSYTKTTDFAVKDALLTGNPAKLVKGTEIDNEFNAIVVADALNVKGPTSATANAVALFDGTTGKLVKDSAKTLPTGAIVGTTDSQTLTTKTISLTSNTLTGTKAQFDTACSDGDFAYQSDIGTTIQAYVAPGTSGNVLTSNGSAWTSAAPASSGGGSFKNKIIGGDFTTNPWQRGTSFTALANAAYGPDRFFVSYVQDGVVDLLKTADVPTAAEAGVYATHCLHLDVTTADASLAADQRYLVVHRVEGFNAAPFGFGQAGTRNVTLSFWHKHTKTGTNCVALRNSASNRSYVAEYTQDVTNTWEKATLTIPVDTSGTWLYDSGIGLEIRFGVALAGSTFTTTAGSWQAGNFMGTTNQVNNLDNIANNFKIALVQLESGDTATTFESRPVGVEVALCQRYYWRLTSLTDTDIASATFAPGLVQTATAGQSVITLPVTMRIAPTSLEQSGTATDYRVRLSGTAPVCSAVPTFGLSSKSNVTINWTIASGGTAGDACSFGFNASSGYVGIPAEL